MEVARLPVGGFCMLRCLKERTPKLVHTIVALLVLALVVSTVTIVTTVKAESQIFYNFTVSGESPGSYGALLDSDGIWQYVYAFQATSDDQNITSIEYEIDSEGRVDLAGNSTTGAFDSLSEEVILTLDHIPYADGQNHSITFYVSTVDLVETSQSFTLEPVADATPPVITPTVATEGYTLAGTFPFVLEVSDAFIESVTIELDGVPVSPTPDSNSWTQRTYDFDAASFDVPGVDLFDGNPHTLAIEANDGYGNMSTDSYVFTYGEDPEADNAGPVIAFTASKSGLSKLPVTYTGTFDDASEITWYAYSIDDQEFGLLVDDETSTTTHKAFTLSLSELTEGEHVVKFSAEDVHGNRSDQSFTVDIDASAPSCTNTWYNLPSPNYSRTLNYTNITCTDNRSITQAAYSVYHIVFDTLIDEGVGQLLPADGVFDEATETFSIPVDLTGFNNIDGVVNITLRTWDEAGNIGSDYDPVIIDYDDDTAPVINLDAISPDPLTDKTPTITGSCRDMTDRETNSYISNLEYKVNDDAYQSITLLDGGSYNDAYRESYSTELAELANGDYTVTVRCTDAAGHSATASDSFTITDPVDPNPGEFTYVEQFESYNNQDIPSSNDVIWGNGKLRLKEDITLTRTLIDGDEACPRYGDCRGLWRPFVDPQNPDLIWYYMNHKIFTYNVQTEVLTQFEYATTYSVPQMSGELWGFALGMYEGKKYLWMSDIYGLYAINLTDGVGAYDASYDNVSNISLDFARGRFGAYVTIDPSGGSSNLGYIDLQVLSDPDDNLLTRIPYATLNSDGVVGLQLDPVDDAVYAGMYGVSRVYKFDDQDTPHNTADDVVTYYESADYNSVFGGMTLDPDRRLIFGTANNSNGQVFVVEDDNGTPFDASDDTVTRLATPLQLGYRNVYGIEYIVGENGIGDQLLLNTEGNIPVYLNFNSTYSNPYDDTFIELDTQANVRPGGSTAVMYDYQTMYVVSKVQGFYKVDLNRGWKDSGEAVAIPTRPPEQLIIDNFVAEANVGGTIALVPASSTSHLAELGKTIIPQAYAAPGDSVRYYVSTDGGITWTEVTLGQLQQLQQTDYRVKFKIELAEVGGATPVLDSYSLAYAGYPDEVQATTAVGMTVTPAVTTTTTGATFSLTTQVVDVLGFPTPGYTSTATLSLIDTSTGNPTTGLNVSSLNLTNGTGSVTGVQISRVGTFKIRASDGTYTQDSATITVSDGSSLPTPAISLSSNTYKIKKGETATLSWTSSNVTSFVLNPGNHQFASTSGTFNVSPGNTTEYTMVGSGSYGSIGASVIIVVEGEVANTPAASPTPSPSASPRTGYRASTSETSLLEASESATTTTPSTTDRFSSDQTIIRGQKAEIFWDIPFADEVVIDYPERKSVGPKGSFEFYPFETTVITITARRDGETFSKQITVTVINAPLAIQQLARTLQQSFPGSTPVVSTTVNTIKRLPGAVLATTIVVQAGTVGLLSLLIAGQHGISALLNFKTMGNVLTVAGLLPAKKRKGFVHQTLNGVPVPFATITVTESRPSAQQPLIVTLISDMYGAYLEPYLPQGSYVFNVAHSAYSFPTRANRPVHLSVKDFYKGEPLAVASNKEKTSLLIPVDPTLSSPGPQAWRYRVLLRVTRLLSRLHWTVYPLTVLSLVAVWLSTSIWNIVIAGIYLVVVARSLWQRLKKPSISGQVVQSHDRRPVKHATLILTTGDGQVIAIDKSDKTGRFAFFVLPGKYSLNVIASNLVWDEAKVGSNYMVEVGTRQPATIKILMSKLSTMDGISL